MWTFFSPHSLNFFIAQSAAAWYPGVPVARGPEAFGQPPVRVHRLRLRHRLATNSRDRRLVNTGLLAAKR
jgi:hypothetical protein